MYVDAKAFSNECIAVQELLTTLQSAEKLLSETNTPNYTTTASCEELDNSIEEIEKLIRKYKYLIEGNEFQAHRELVATTPIVEYQVKNIGNQPIPYKRMEATQNHTVTDHMLNPGESVCLSRAELTLTASIPEISFTLGNGRISSGTVKQIASKELWITLNSHCFVFNDRTNIH